MAADVRKIRQRYDDLRSARLLWDYFFQEVNDFVHPNTRQFNRKSYPGQPRTRRIYEGTALMSRAELSSGLQSYVMSATDRWFNVVTHDHGLARDPQNLLYLETVSDLVYFYFSIPRVKFNPTGNSVFNDVAAYGTGVMYADFDPVFRQPVYRSIPLSSCFIDQDYAGNIDTMYRVQSWNGRQANQMFGKLPEKLQRMGDKEPQREFEFLQAVEPNEGYYANSKSNKKMRYASCWMCLDTDDLLVESGYRRFPYIVPRWSIGTGEVYGRSPGLDSMPFIKYINALSRIMIGAGEKAIDPPMLVPDDGFLGPIATVPGSLIRYDSTSVNMGEMIKPLLSGAKLDFGIQDLNRYSDIIQRAFFIPFLMASRKKERQSVPEIQDDRDQMLRMLAAPLAQLETEFLGPVLARTYDMLSYNNLLPPPPPALQKASLKIEFVSQAARAQTGTKVTAITQMLQDFVPLAQVNQNVFDVIDTDVAAQEIAIARDITRRIIRQPKDIAAIRDQRNQQQQMQAGAAQGAQMAGAVKDLATARSLGGTSPILQ